MFRRSREIAGAFVLLAAGLLIAGIVMHGQIRGWFQPKNIFEVALPEAGTQGVRPGSEVYIMGNKAGTVTRVEMRRKITESAISAAPTAPTTDSDVNDPFIAYTDEPLSDYTDVPANEIVLVAILEIRGGLSVFVGGNSHAILKRDLGGFGSSFFDIERDNSSWKAGEEGKLRFQSPTEMQDELSAVVAVIRDEVSPALVKAGNGIADLADQLKDEEGGFQKTLTSLGSIVEGIEQGDSVLNLLVNDEQEKDLSATLASAKTTSEKLKDAISTLADAVDEMEDGNGVLGTLLNDKPAGEDLAETLDGINTAVSSLNTSLTAIEGGAKQFPATVSNVNDVVGEIGEAVFILQEALSEIELVAEGLQGHWLVKGSVEDVKKDRKKAEEAQLRAQAEAAAKASGVAVPEEKKRRGLFFWRK